MIIFFFSFYLKRNLSRNCKTKSTQQLFILSMNWRNLFLIYIYVYIRSKLLWLLLSNLKISLYSRNGIKSVFGGPFVDVFMLFSHFSFKQTMKFILSFKLKIGLIFGKFNSFLILGAFFKKKTFVNENKNKKKRII